MHELKERFQELEQLPAPDLQQLIQLGVQRLRQPDPLVSVAEQAWRRYNRRRGAPLVTQVLAAAAIVAVGVGLALIFHARTVAPASGKCSGKPRLPLTPHQLPATCVVPIARGELPPTFRAATVTIQVRGG